MSDAINNSSTGLIKRVTVLEATAGGTYMIAGYDHNVSLNSSTTSYSHTYSGDSGEKSTTFTYKFYQQYAEYDTGIIRIYTDAGTTFKTSRNTSSSFSTYAIAGFRMSLAVTSSGTEVSPSNYGGTREVSCNYSNTPQNVTITSSNRGFYDFVVNFGIQYTLTLTLYTNGSAREACVGSISIPANCLKIGYNVQSVTTGNAIVVQQ